MNDTDQRDGTFIGREEAFSETGDETAEIRAGIEQTRSEMSETIGAIQERLSPEHLKEQVKEQVKEQFQEVKATVRDATIGKAEEMVRNVGDTVTEARATIMETIRQNPIPAAMVGIGLGWLLMNRRSAAPYRPMRYSSQGGYRGSQMDYEGARYSSSSPMYAAGQRNYSGSGVVEQGQRVVGDTVQRVQETASTVASRAQETVGNLADRAQETVGTIVNQAQETASTIADQAQYQTQRIEDRFQQTLRENPLAVGAVAFALGTAVGFAVPETRKEHELMGEARDNLVDKVQTAVQDTVEKVQRVAGDVMEEAQTTAREAAQEQGLTSG